MHRWLMALVLFACGSPSTDSMTADTNAVPRFADEEIGGAFVGRARVSIGDAAFVEANGVAGSLAEAKREDASLRLLVNAMPLDVTIGFGRAGEARPSVGSYTCEAHDAFVARRTIDRVHHLAISDAAETCSITIDDVKPGPSAAFARTYGHFEAPGPGLGVRVRGVFEVDIPIDPR